MSNALSVLDHLQLKQEKFNCDILIPAKIQIPAGRSGLIKRSFLNESLNGAGDYKLTLVVAPAGYGKTTAVAEWARNEGFPSAWVSLDSEDNCPSNFWRYIYLALRKIMIHKEHKEFIGEKRLKYYSRRASSSGISRSYYAKVLALLMSDDNAGAAIKSQEQFTLVIDDYHHIQDQSIHQELKQLIRYIPANMHLILISRAEPNLSLNQFRAKGYIRELGIEQLIFRKEEIKAYFAQSDFQLTDDDLDKIETKTQGWIVALHFLIMTLGEYGYRPGAADLLNCSNRHLAEFFEEEILGEYPEEIKLFLEQTSFLNRFCVSLSEAVTGRKDCGEILSRLLKDHAQISFEGYDHCWYRYHPLLADYLRNRLQNKSAAAQRNLYRVAGEWCAKNGCRMDAVSYFIEAGEEEKAVQILEEEAPGMLWHGEYAEYLKQADRISEELRRKSIVHCLAQAYSLLLSGQEGEALKWTDYAEKSRTAAQGQREITLLKANFILREKKSIEAARLLGESLNQPGLNIFPSIIAGINQGEASLLSAFAGFYGNLQEMEKFYLTAYGVLKSSCQEQIGYVPAALAEVLYEQNRLAEVFPFLELGIEEARRFHRPGVLVPALLTLSRLEKVRGCQEAALEISTEIYSDWNKGADLHWRRLLEAYWARNALTNNDLDAAAEWLKGSGLSLGSCYEAAQEYEYLTWARLLKAQQRYEEAIFLLTRLGSLAEKENRIPGLIEIYNLTAMLYQDKGEMGKALQIFYKSLALGEKNGYIRSYVDEGQEMLALLGRFCRNFDKYFPQDKGRALVRYGRKLERLIRESVSRSSGSVPSGKSGQQAAAWAAAQLTRRERQVFQLIAQEMTNVEIAGELGVSCQTVKIHASNVYGKLGVKNRMQAILRGKELQIL